MKYNNFKLLLKKINSNLIEFINVEIMSINLDKIKNTEYQFIEQLIICLGKELEKYKSEIVNEDRRLVVLCLWNDLIISKIILNYNIPLIGILPEIAKTIANHNSLKYRVIYSSNVCICTIYKYIENFIINPKCKM